LYVPLAYPVRPADEPTDAYVTVSEPVLNAVLRLYCAAQMSIMLARKLAPPPPIAAALAGAATPAVLATARAAATAS